MSETESATFFGRQLYMIYMQVEKRSGNKSVTLLSNLAIYGVNAKDFAKKIQVAVATSATTVPNAVQCEGPQLLVQGNHVRYVSQLLQDEYGIDKKYIAGLELGLKQKK